jgi:tetratricopeptide (TPR) repeat protein
MIRRRVLVPLGVVLLVVGVVTATVSHHSAAAGTDALLTSPRDAAVSGTGTRAQALERAQARLRTAPRDWKGWAALGSLEVEQARVTADPTWYPRAAGAFARSLSLQPNDNVDGLVGRAMLANARHDFAGALRLGERAKLLRPYNASVYGVIGDAQVELGRYDDATATIQRMVDLRPDLASYSRVSYLRELHGDVDGAAAALDIAAQVAGNPSDAAFASFQLGELRWNAGDVAGATAAYERAVKLDPTYVPPVAALARVHAATGDEAAAAAEYVAAIARVPAPQYVTELGDLYAVSGHAAQAANEVKLLGAEEQLFRANGVNIDLEISLFSADHHRNLARGLRAALDAYARRQSVFVADALAWQLHVNGRDAEALTHANEALRLGTRSALFHFHRGMIELSLGRTDAGRADLQQALAINPHFSLLHAPEATNLSKM